MDAWFKEAGTVKAEVLMPEPSPEVSWDPSLRSDVLGTDSPEPDP